MWLKMLVFAFDFFLHCSSVNLTTMCIIYIYNHSLQLCEARYNIIKIKLITHVYCNIIKFFHYKVKI